MKKAWLILGSLIVMGCNTTSKQESARAGADLTNRNCYELNESDCQTARHCQFDYQQYSCDRVGAINGPVICSNFNSEFDCPRSQCRWSGYSCDSLTGNSFNGNSQCQFYNNDPAGCQNQGCIYQNNTCQMNPSMSYPGGVNSQNINCSNVFQPNVCASTPGCQWLGNICQRRY